MYLKAEECKKNINELCFTPETINPFRLMLFKEKINVYCEDLTKHINSMCEHKAGGLYVKSRCWRI
jgi:hypothetical protein